jgi:hypothetical protein
MSKTDALVGKQNNLDQNDFGAGVVLNLKTEVNQPRMNGNRRE